MKNSKLRKVLLLACSAVLLVCLSVGATIAYLTDKDEVVNTFSVGNVNIKLDEAKATADGEKVEGVDRVQANSYKLLPGHTYSKDPMVTVIKDSESAYVKMTVTFDKVAALDDIFATTEAGKANLTEIFTGYDGTTWLYKGYTDGTNDTRTYEFWYKEAVAAPTKDVELTPLFTNVVVPGFITNEQLATLEGMTITVNAYAIQADGFNTPELAWAAYPAN